MILSQFRHQSDSRYCFSLDEHRVLVRLAVARLSLVERVELVYGDPFKYDRERKRVEMSIKHEDVDFLYYEGIMESDIPRFYYIFHIIGKDGEMDLAESGLTKDFRYGLAFLSAFQFNGENRIDFVLANPRFKGRIVYQIFPERFAIGNKKDLKSC